VRNSIETQPGCLEQLEEEFKHEIWKQSKVREMMLKKM